MKIAEFVFHGVPQGFDVWGTSGDSYYESFYNILDTFKNAQSAFVVEIRKDSNKFCSYYSYIRPQNVIAGGGRTGSYFGMSLKVEGNYCTDVHSLFNLFDTIYTQKISGRLLSNNENSERYLIANFKDVDGELTEISKLAISQIVANFEGDFEVIDSTFTKQNASKSVYYNINDVNCETFFNATKIYGKVYVSPVYTSKDAIIASLLSSDQKYQEIKREYEDQIDVLKKDSKQIPGLQQKLIMISNDLSTVKSENQRLRVELNSLKSTNSSLRQDNANLRQEVDRLKKCSNIGAVADRLEPNLSEMLEILSSVKTNGAIEQSGFKPNNKHRGYPSHWRGQNPKKFILYIIVAVAIILAMFFCVKGIKSVSKISELKKQYTALTTKNSELEAKCSELTKALSLIQSGQTSPQKISLVIKDDLNTEVNEPLIKGKKYKIILTGVQEGEWKNDGFLISGSKKQREITATPIPGTSHVLSYYVNKNKVFTHSFKVNER